MSRTDLLDADWVAGEEPPRNIGDVISTDSAATFIAQGGVVQSSSGTQYYMGSNNKSYLRRTARDLPHEGVFPGDEETYIVAGMPPTQQFDRSRVRKLLLDIIGAMECNPQREQDSLLLSLAQGVQVYAEAIGITLPEEVSPGQKTP